MRADPFAAVVRHIIAPLWAWHERSSYLRDYRTVLQTQFQPPAEVRRRQWNAVREILMHACATTEFWRERLTRAGLEPSGAMTPEHYRLLPPLTKAELRDNGARMLSYQYNKRDLIAKTTSGSTGESVCVFVHDDRQQWTRACVLRCDEWSGWRLGERVAALWGNPEYKNRGIRGRLRNQFLERAEYLDTLKMNEAAMERFAQSLERHPPSLLFGHAHSLYLFAQFCRARGSVRFRPKGIISTAMVLHQSERILIENVFGCAVTNRYGCEEVGLIACECERHNGLHVNAECVFVEILRADGSPANPGEIGAVVVTDLVNRAMPILRYRVGDMAALVDRQCPCGRGLPLIERIEGRIADYVVTLGGELISGISLTENFAMLVPGLAQLQIVQEAVDRFTFRIVRGADWGPSSVARIATLVTERFGHGTRYNCEFVEKIPQESSGKYRFCISKVPNPFSQPTPTL